jgi:2-C-methyl-D-erythritol 4-phosphate cytidylyltransferase
MLKNKIVTAIIVAAGRGSRMKSEIPKQYMPIAGKTILETTLNKFEKNNYVYEIILVVNEEDLDKVKDKIACNYKKISKVVIGGNTRTVSVHEGIKNATKNCDIVLVHDGVRPFISHNLINRCVETADEYQACIPVLDIVDTIKYVKDEYVEETIDRSMLKRVQTPQAFDYKLIKDCYEKAAEEKDVQFTDDSTIVEHYGYKVKTIEGLQKNIKITTPLDYRMAEILASIY